jgi:hypothetical protein
MVFEILRWRPLPFHTLIILEVQVEAIAIIALDNRPTTCPPVRPNDEVPWACLTVFGSMAWELP